MKLLLYITLNLLPFISTAQNWYYNKVMTIDYNLKLGKNRYDTVDLKGSFLQIKYTGDRLIINRDSLDVTTYSVKPDTLLTRDYDSNNNWYPVLKIVPFILIDVADKEGGKGSVMIYGDVMFLDYLLNKDFRRIMEYRLVDKIRSVSDRKY